MEYLKDRIIRLFITLIISACICIVASLFISGEEFEIGLVVKGMILGGIIWFISEFATDVVAKIWPYNSLPMYIVLSLIIIGGTSIGLVLLKADSIWFILIICGIAEIVGLLITICTRKIYKKKLNKHLKKFKKEIEEDI